MQTLVFNGMEVDKEYTLVRYTCSFGVETAGDGLWGCEAGRQVHVTGITVVHNVFDGEIYTQVNVEHDSTWDIYTDSAFEAAISKAIEFDVRFTEQGMQDDGFASMEA